MLRNDCYVILRDFLKYRLRIMYLSATIKEKLVDWKLYEV